MGMTRFDTPGYHEYKAVDTSRGIVAIETTPKKPKMATQTEIKKAVNAYRPPETINRKIGQPDPVRSVIDSILPPLAFAPGGSASGATEIVVKHPEIIIGSVFPPAAIAGGPLGTPGYLGKKATDELVVEQVKRDPDIPQEIKNDFERQYLETYEKFEQDVKDMPGQVINNIKIPEIKLPEWPKFSSLWPDFSGLGKWLLIGGAILAAILILPALLGRRAVKTIA
jgi:hypothetical protein